MLTTPAFDRLLFSPDVIIIFGNLDAGFHSFHTFIITNFKTDTYPNNFQEHLFGILRLRKYQTSLQIFFPT